MKTSARVVVIGGGVCGVSTLYHLAKMGWSDVVLCERTELTAGSTWHAAGLLPLFNMSYSVGQLHQYSVELYKKLEEETGQDVSFHVVGNLRLARNQNRMDEYRNYASTADTIGINYELIGPDEIKKLWPLINMDGLIGALWHPDDGHIAPVDLTMALAKGARMYGAEIYQQTEVTAIDQKQNGEWVVTTNKGEITCEHIVSATGNYPQQTADMVGLSLPAIPVEHQFIVSDVDPVLKEYREAGHAELPVLRESDSQYYFREERMGWILGPYEEGAPARFAHGVPSTFEKDLFPGELERLMPHVEAAMSRVPSFANTGIKDIVNGPICYTPDGNPLVGPAYSLKNFWLSEGHSFGITAAGGAGWQLAHWIINGEPTVDMWGVDPRRFGAYANKNYAVKKNEEAYSHVFINHFPMEERPACRPQRTTPCYDRLKDAGACFGMAFGWERPNWFAPKGVEPVDDYSFRRSNWFEHVGNEVATMRERVGLLELSSFSKYEVEGPGAFEWLNKMIANTVPKKEGRINLCHALNPSGSVRSEFTITKLGHDHYYLIGPGAGNAYDYDFLRKQLPADRSVFLKDVTNQFGVFVVAGPDAKKVMDQLVYADLSNEAFPWLTHKEINVGMASNVRTLRVNFVGGYGWELHHPIEYQNHLFDVIMEAGKKYDIGLVGMRAMDSMRLEKTYRAWSTDLNAENSLLEAGLERFARFKKPFDFVGKEALLRQKENGIPTTFSTIEVDAADADCFGNEPIIINGEVVGRGTAGGYGHHVKKSLLLGYVNTEHAAIGTECHVRVLDELRPARIIEESPYDPENLALRGLL